MEYIFEYAICSLLFLGIIIVQFFSKRQLPNLQNRIYAVAIILAFIDVLMDILSSLVIENVATLPAFVTYFINSLFYIVQLAFPTMMALYVIALTKNLRKANRRYVILSMLPTVFAVLLILINPANHWVFYTKDNMYCRGPLFPFLYGTAIFYMILTVILINKYRSRIPKSHVKMVMFFIVITAVTMMLQIIFPAYLITCLAITASLLLMYLIMQKPDSLLDSLTGLFNKEALIQYIDNRINENQDYQVLLIKVNHIRRINTLFGYTSGNIIMQNVASFLSSYTPDNPLQKDPDLLPYREHTDNSGRTPAMWSFRLMSNQFVVVTRSKEHHATIVKTIIDRFHENWTLHGMSISLGATMVDFEDTSDISSSEELIRLLESILPTVPRGELRAVDSKILSEINRVAVIENALLDAIEKGALEVYFQPIYSVKDKAYTGAEALVRFRHKTLGNISPSEFIPIAEKNGLILNVDELVLRKVCSFIHDYDPFHTLGLNSIEVNLSVAEFVHELLPDRIGTIIDEYHIEHSRIQFEITETAATQEHAMLANSMAAMKKNGFRFVLDDFGTGYANITQITHLPFTTVKLDRSMLIADEENRENHLVFAHTVRMLQELGLQTVVEGVETKMQSDMLHRINIDYIQGFLYARPMPIEAFVLFLKEKM